MPGTESANIEYLSTAFKRLSVEKKDCVLNAARSLLEIQAGGICHASANKETRRPRRSRQGFCVNNGMYVP